MFVIIRGLCLFWLWYTFYISLPYVPIIPQWIAFISLPGICVITLVLLFRLIMADFINYYSQTLNSGTNGKQLTKDQTIDDQMLSPVNKGNGFVYSDYQQKKTLRLRENS